MKTLIFALLLTFSFSAQAARTVLVCNTYNQCQYITVYDNQPKPNQQLHNNLIDNISNSGAKNFDRINQGWNPQQYPKYPKY